MPQILDYCVIAELADCPADDCYTYAVTTCGATSSSIAAIGETRPQPIEQFGMCWFFHRRSRLEWATIPRPNGCKYDNNERRTAISGSVTSANSLGRSLSQVGHQTH